MSELQVKSCPRCKTKFECNPGDIEQCQCYGIALSAMQKVKMQQEHNDCFCKTCLQLLAKEPDSLKEANTIR